MMLYQSQTCYTQVYYFPGVKKIGEKDAEDEDGKEPEYKFEWQRTWGHAPKESYLQKGDDFNEQPFGIQVKYQFTHVPLC